MLITQFLRSLALIFFCQHTSHPLRFAHLVFMMWQPTVHRRIERSNNAVLDEAKNKNDICIRKGFHYPQKVWIFIRFYQYFNNIEYSISDFCWLNFVKRGARIDRFMELLCRFSYKNFACHDVKLGLTFDPKLLITSWKRKKTKT